ncbi:MAG: hypothetical protein K2X87_05075, partial [Gemmataceae bacterium]|nr:hypothetical protein [Gemmataceae bacterium]
RGQRGRRFDALPALADAAVIARRLGASAADLGTIRGEAVAALTLADVRLVREADVLPPDGPLAVSPDHAHHAAAGTSGPVHVRRLVDDAAVAELPTPDGWGVTDLEFAPDGRALLVVSSGPAGHRVKYWPWAAGGSGWGRAGRNPHHWAFRPDGRVLALTHRAAKAVDLLDPATGTPAGAIPLPDPSARVAFHPNGRELAAVGPRLAAVFDTDTRKLVFRLHEARPAGDVAWFPDRGRIALVGQDGGWVGLYDPKTGRRAGRPWEPGGPVRLSFAAAAPLLLTRAPDGTGRVWDAGTMEELLTVPSVGGGLSADGRRVVGRAGTRLQVWELSPRPVVRRVPVGAGGQELTAGGFSPDGRRVAVGSAGGLGVTVFDAASGSPVGSVAADARDAVPEFTPDGQTLIVGTYEAFTLWDTTTWQPTGRRGREPGCEHPGRVAFTPDGSLAAWVVGRETVLLTDGAGRSLARLPVAGGGPARHPLFSPDGQTLAVLAGADLHLWDLAAARAGLREVGLDWADDPPPPGRRPRPRSWSPGPTGSGAGGGGRRPSRPGGWSTRPTRTPNWRSGCGRPGR